jgi:hypothetical protein
MTRYRIYYRERPHDPWELCYNHDGSPKTAMASVMQCVNQSIELGEQTQYGIKKDGSEAIKLVRRPRKKGKGKPDADE